MLNVPWGLDKGMSTPTDGACRDAVIKSSACPLNLVRDFGREERLNRTPLAQSKSQDSISSTLSAAPSPRHPQPPCPPPPLPSPPNPSHHRLLYTMSTPKKTKHGASWTRSTSAPHGNPLPRIPSPSAMLWLPTWMGQRSEHAQHQITARWTCRMGGKTIWRFRISRR